MENQELFDKTIEKVKSEMDKFKGEMPTKAELATIGTRLMVANFYLALRQMK